MPMGQLDLLFDQIKIIEQPFRRGRDTPAFIHRQSRAIKSAQHFLILIQPREQPSGSAACDDLYVAPR